MLFKLAWRNIWRSKTRTFITMAMIFLAVILSSMMMSVKEGTYVNMIDSMIGSFTGYAQVHQKGYWDERVIDNSFELTEKVDSIIKTNPKVIGYYPRLESFSLATANDVSKVVMINGIDITKEDISHQVKKGKLFNKDDRKALVGTGLAKYLKLDVGDTIILIGSGYHGASAAGMYEISGLVKMGSPEISKQLVVLPLKEAQWFLNAEDICSTIILNIENKDDAFPIAKDLQTKFGDEYEVMDWNELVPSLQQMIDGDKVEGYIFMLILYMVISFGVFGTVLMMLSERRHEFGVLISLGMKKIKLGTVVWMEVILMSIIATIAGVIVVFPIAATMHYNPIELGSETKDMMEEYGMEAIIQASIDPSIFITQGVIVFIISSIIALYPIRKIMKINAIEAMRS